MTPTPESFTRHLLLRGMRRELAQAVKLLALYTVGIVVVTVEGWWRKEGR
jgi:hypothetical protein